MSRVLLWAGAAALALLVTLSAALILPACGLVLPFGLGTWAACPPVIVQSTEDATRDGLQAEIAGLERQIAALQCLPEPEPELRAETPPLPEPELGEDMLERADVGDLEGCWELDSPYAAQNRATGEVIEFSEWNVCFSADGTGRETMKGSDGSTCEGPVTGNFIPGQALIIEEPADLPCSNNLAILRRTVTCRLDLEQRAVCNSYQAEGGGNAEVIMRRLQEAP